MTLKQKSESEIAQSCPALCDPMDYSLPGSSIHGIFQSRVLEWSAISFSRGSSRPRDRTQVSRIVGRRFTVWTTREVLLHRGPSNSWWKRVKFSQLLVPLMPWIFSTFPAGSVKEFSGYLSFAWKLSLASPLPSGQNLSPSPDPQGLSRSVWLLPSHLTRPHWDACGSL